MAWAALPPAGTATTFTSAEWVRRGLQAAGFDMHRVDQRPHKRESLAGLYRNSSARNRVNNAVQCRFTALASPEPALLDTWRSGMWMFRFTIRWA